MTFTSINSIYIHIPFCISKCHYCDFFSVPCKKADEFYIPQEYINALINELEFKAKRYNLSSIKTIYIGGGTPSLLKPLQFKLLVRKINELFVFNNDYEFTIEVNPDDVTQEFLDNLLQTPVNRISCGIQSLNDKVLKSVNRRAGRNENLAAIKLLKEKWNRRLSLDLIAALPDDDEKSFMESLKIVCSSNADHISLYSLTIEEETELGKKITSGCLDYDYDWADSVWIKGKEYLEKNGFYQYEISNFAKKGNECLHNLTYWKHESYLGIGAGAAGTVYYNDGSGIRENNLNKIDEYIKKWTSDLESGKNNYCDYVQIEQIDLETSKFEYFMMGLRKRSGVSKNDYIKRFSSGFPESVHKLFEKWKEKNLAQIDECGSDLIYSLNAEGLLFLNSFLSELEI